LKPEEEGVGGFRAEMAVGNSKSEGNNLKRKSREGDENKTRFPTAEETRKKNDGRATWLEGE